MCVKYSYISRKLHALIFHAITCITCSSASRCLRDFRSSGGSFGSPVLVISVYCDTQLLSTEHAISSITPNTTVLHPTYIQLYFNTTN